jgi:hypothetical protein
VNPDLIFAHALKYAIPARAQWIDRVLSRSFLPWS